MSFQIPYFYSVKLLFCSCLTVILTITTIGQTKSEIQNYNKRKNAFEWSINDTLNRHLTLAKLSDQPQLINTSNNLTECNTSTFFIHFSAATAQKINIKELQTLPDGNFMISGNIKLANSEYEGLICTITNSGTILSQKQIRINNKPVTLFATKVMIDGKIIIAGVLHDVTDKIFISLLNSNLSTVWLNIFEMPSLPIKVSLDYMENEQVCFAVQLSNSLIYSVLNPNGSLLWSKQAFPTGLNDLVGIGHTDFAELNMLSNCTRAGKTVAEILRISQSSGATLSAHTIGSNNNENKYDKITSFNNRFILSGVTKNNFSQYKLVRNIAYNSAEIETEHTYSIVGGIDFNTTSSMDNAGDALGYCIPLQGKFVFIRHFSAYQTAPEYTREYNVPVGSSVIATTRSLIDGGYLFGLNTVDSSEFILIKTDSIGTLPGCGYQDISNAYTETLLQQNSISNTIGSNIPLATTTATISINTTVITTNSDCNQIYCPTSPPDDTCLSSYFKLLRTNSYVDAFGNYYLMKDNKQISVTARYDRIWGTSNIITYGVKLFNEKGYFVKGVNVFLDNATAPVLSRQIDDKHIMLILYSTSNGIPCYTFTLIDDNLQILWSKTVKTFAGFNYNSSLLMGDLTSDSEGNFYFVGNNLGFGETRKVLAYKMDANGNPLWLKIYDVEGNLFLTCSATTTNSSLVIVIEGSPRSASVRIDKITGQLQNAYTFITNPDGAVYTRFLKFENDRIYYRGNNHSDFLMGLFDINGRPVKFKTINGYGTGSETVKNGNFYVTTEFFDGTNYRGIIFKTDSALNIQYSRDMGILEYGSAVGLGVSNEGNIYMAGNYSYGGNNSSYYDPFIKKIEPDGVLGTCPSSSTFLPVTDMALDVQIPVCNPFVNNFSQITVPVIFINDTAGHRVSELLCSSIPQCTSLDISGPDTICQLNQPYTYNIQRNAGCILLPEWIYDTAFASLLNNTGSTANFIFKKVGNTWLKAKINTGCNSFYDSILIKIQNAPQFFSLGNDTVMCPGSNILLHAGNGFNSYVWQDGSTDSVFTAVQPGQYHVKVTNLCGNTYRDTLIISPAIIPALSIGQDSAVCYGDTLNLFASAGFSIYIWQPSSLIVRQGQQVHIVPKQNERVTVIATTQNGCQALDTLNVTSITARPVSLGNDTSFCASGSVVLLGGAGYSQYIWSTGSNNTSITVNQAGIYWLKVIDTNACITNDTIIIKQVFALPKPNLGVDFNLCIGEQKRLDAGNFNKYLWGNGSTSRFETVNFPGNYWVTVTDNNNCIASDTIVLKNILPIPTNFLEAADSICQYEKLIIKPLSNYQSYLWSTGSVLQTISVENPGQYSLTATDFNGCSGSDTIKIIQKKCYQGIFFPNAFTPNGDQMNDVFKPRVYGSIISFRLEVYNRYGEIVFVTTNPQQGWDGTYKGSPQSFSVFTWQCIYQFAGGTNSFEKGIITLIR